MEATAPGNNRTGAARAPDGVKLMLDAVDDLSPPAPVNTKLIDAERQHYILEASAVGSIPPTQADERPRKGRGAQPEVAPVLGVFLDKLGERIAFERTGVRLYDALITKFLALSNSQQVLDDGALQTLQKIRADELEHFQLLCECVETLGGDPTAQTPCADVTAAASIGIMQVVTDPRTTLAQSLGAILTAELTDNAAWEMLSELAHQAGHPEMAEQFVTPLENETEHLTTVRSWLESLLMNNAGSLAV
jgi:hypothetical protein